MMQNRNLQLFGLGLVGLVLTLLIASGFLPGLISSISIPDIETHSATGPNQTQKDHERMPAIKTSVVRGTEAEGLNTGIVLAPGETARIEWVRGNLVAFMPPDGPDGIWTLYENDRGSGMLIPHPINGPLQYPLWGAGEYVEGWEDKYRFNHCNMRPFAVLAVLGDIDGAPCNSVYGFGYQNSVIVVKNHNPVPLPLKLYYHDTLEYWQSGSDIWPVPQEGAEHIDGFAEPFQKGEIAFRIIVK